jgi:hypothetical protein
MADTGTGNTISPLDATEVQPDLRGPIGAFLRRFGRHDLRGCADRAAGPQPAGAAPDPGVGSGDGVRGVVAPKPATATEAAFGAGVYPGSAIAARAPEPSVRVPTLTELQTAVSTFRDDNFFTVSPASVKVVATNLTLSPVLPEPSTMSTAAVTPVVETPTVTEVITPAPAATSAPVTTSSAPAPAVTTVAPVTENKFQSFISKAAADFIKVDNALVNIVTAEQPLLTQLLPPQYASTEAAVNELFRNTLLEVEAGYATINPSASFSTKIARVVAITAPAVVQLLANIGVQASQAQLTSLATGATAFANLQSSGNLTTLTASTPATT